MLGRVPSWIRDSCPRAPTRVQTHSAIWTSAVDSGRRASRRRHDTSVHRSLTLCRERRPTGVVAERSAKSASRRLGGPRAGRVGHTVSGDVRVVETEDVAAVTRSATSTRGRRSRARGEHRVGDVNGASRPGLRCGRSPVRSGSVTYDLDVGEAPADEAQRTLRTAPSAATFAPAPAPASRSRTSSAGPRLAWVATPSRLEAFELTPYKQHSRHGVRRDGRSSPRARPCSGSSSHFSSRSSYRPGQWLEQSA